MKLSIFAVEEEYEKLERHGYQLQKLSIINWEDFRPYLEKAFIKDRKSNAGRPPFNILMMFKILVLQRLYNMSDDEIELQIIDRLSFKKFIGLQFGEHVPDAKTIWLFRDTLSKTVVIEDLFNMFNNMLDSKHIITKVGTIIDATFVDAPRQRNSREENKKIKEDEIPENWKENPHKLAQKDTDARWVEKNKETHYGYKDHVKVDAESKIILDYKTSAANLHDSNVFTEFLTEDDKVVYADSAYCGKEIPEHIENQVCEKGVRGKPLTEQQIKSNREKSKTRCRIEHVFGYMTGSMHGITVRSIGIRRADFNIGLTNLIYNICRYTIIKRNEKCIG